MKTCLNRKKIIRVFFCFLILGAFWVSQADSQTAKTYQLDFSTYLGGSGFDHARDVFVDSQGNVYVVGGTASANFSTTTGVYDNSYNGGTSDIFVSKFDSRGNLLWSTFLGGPGHDRAYAVEVDNQGYVYVGGRGGPNAPVTSGAVQKTFSGYWAGGDYQSEMNAYLAKLSPDGASLIWATYFGCGHGLRDIDIDQNNDVYFVWDDPSIAANPKCLNWGNSAWFANAYQKNRQGQEDTGFAKISSDGTQIFWATYLSGSDDDGSAASIRVDGNGNVYTAMFTRSTNMPTTPGAYDQTHNGGVDYYLAKLSADGSHLVFGTYLGGSGDEYINTHNLALDNQGNAYVSVPAHADFPVTAGVFQSVYGGGSLDLAIVKISATGGLAASTFIGGSGAENPDGLYVDDFGNVFIFGESDSSDFPTTANSYQPNKAGGKDGVLAKLSADFRQLLYSTYLGGLNDDAFRSGFLGQDGSLYGVGENKGPGWPTKNAHQSSFGGGTSDALLAKFTPVSATPTAMFLPADLNQDSRVDEVDLTLFLGQWKTLQLSLASLLGAWRP